MVPTTPSLTRVKLSLLLVIFALAKTCGATSLGDLNSTELIIGVPLGSAVVVIIILVWIAICCNHWKSSWTSWKYGKWLKRQTLRHRQYMERRRQQQQKREEQRREEEERRRRRRRRSPDRSPTPEPSAPPLTPQLDRRFQPTFLSALSESPSMEFRHSLRNQRDKIRADAAKSLVIGSPQNPAPLFLSPNDPRLKQINSAPPPPTLMSPSSPLTPSSPTSLNPPSTLNSPSSPLHSAPSSPLHPSPPSLLHPTTSSSSLHHPSLPSPLHSSPPAHIHSSPPPLTPHTLTPHTPTPSHSSTQPLPLIPVITIESTDHTKTTPIYTSTSTPHHEYSYINSNHSQQKQEIRSFTVNQQSTPTQHLQNNDRFDASSHAHNMTSSPQFSVNRNNTQRQELLLQSSTYGHNPNYASAPTSTPSSASYCSPLTPRTAVGVYVPKSLWEEEEVDLIRMDNEGEDPPRYSWIFTQQERKDADHTHTSDLLQQAHGTVHSETHSRSHKHKSKRHTKSHDKISSKDKTQGKVNKKQKKSSRTSQQDMNVFDQLSSWPQLV